MAGGLGKALGWEPQEGLRLDFPSAEQGGEYELNQIYIKKTTHSTHPIYNSAL